MKNKVLLLTFGFLLLVLSLNAQQLYFLRATIGDYGYSPLAAARLHRVVKWKKLLNNDYVNELK